MHEKKHLSLLERLAQKAHCRHLDDLQYLELWEHALLARDLERIPAGEAPLEEWNRALDCLAKAPPETTAEKARQQLIRYLSLPLEEEPAAVKKEK